MRAWIGLIGLLCAFGASAAPKIAVTDLAYQAQVEEYIHQVSASNNFQASSYNASGASNYSEYESRSSYIEQTELRKFSGDIKGEILKSRQFQLVQGTPYTADAKGDVYDVIKRIKAGHFKGADYVLFGTLSDIDFTQDINALDHTNSYSAVLRNHLGVYRHGRRPGHQAGEQPRHTREPEPAAGGEGSVEGAG